MTPTLLIVDDEKATREGLRTALEEKFDVYVAADAASAWQLLEKESFEVMLTDLRMAGEDGLSLIKRAKALPKPPICILMTAYGSEDLAVEAMKQGADDYISKGRLQIDELELRIQRALKRQRLESENEQLHQRLDSKFGLQNIIGETGAMKEIFDQIQQIGPTQAKVLITGESGTGKELVAKAIHQLSHRARGPMITVNCAAIPASLLEAELFGHEKGAFTGAHERRIGRVEQAQSGTLFLDEIGEVDPSTQVKLLRLLGERTFERLGSNKTQTADVRFLSATNKDLKTLVKEGKFREDLFYRIAVITIHLPPLRERVGDIPALAQAFLTEFAAENGKKLQGFGTDAMDAMLRYRWPGNVRELRATVERAVVLSRGEWVMARDLPPEVRDLQAEIEASAAETERKIGSGKLSLKEAEKQLIIHALKECGGNRTGAAKKLGISRRTLHRKLHEFGLEEA
ncbi:MAG TPA: sigma-54 dependent transcriptional regulator [Candidatus Limnocylindria bacterium]|jgi:DNA-binding NtrC family response regulator|nr:sigma-54 dependent transcriptional regulator [Candidatus Limnocylindria bacterium]